MQNNPDRIQLLFIHALKEELEYLFTQLRSELSKFERDHLSRVCGCVQELVHGFDSVTFITLLLNGFVNPDYNTSLEPDSVCLDDSYDASLHESYSGVLDCSYYSSNVESCLSSVSEYDNYDDDFDPTQIRHESARINRGHARVKLEIARIVYKISLRVEFCAVFYADRMFRLQHTFIYEMMQSKFKTYASGGDNNATNSAADAAAGQVISPINMKAELKKVKMNETHIRNIMQLTEGIFMAALMLYLSFHLDMAQTLGYVKSGDSLNSVNRTILRFLSLIALSSALSVIKPVYEKSKNTDIDVQRQLCTNIADYMQDMFSYENFNQTAQFIHFMKCHYYLIVMPPRWRQIKSLSDDDKSLLDGEDFIRSKRRQRDVCLLLLGVMQYPTPQNLSSQAGGMVFTEVRNLIHFCVPEPLRMPTCVLMLLALILPSILYLIDASVLPLMCKLVSPFAVASADKNVFARLIVVSLTIPFVHVLFGLSALAYFLYEIPKQLMSNSFSLSKTLSSFTRIAASFCMLTTLLFLLAEHAVPNFLRNEYNSICGDIAFSGMLATLPLVLKVGCVALVFVGIAFYSTALLLKTPIYACNDYGACGVILGLSLELLRASMLPYALGKAYAEVAQIAGVRFSEAMSKRSYLEKPKYPYCARTVEISLGFVPLASLVYYFIHSFYPGARASSLGVMQYAELYTLLAVNSGVISAFYEKSYACNSEVGDVYHMLEARVSTFFNLSRKETAGGTKGWWSIFCNRLGMQNTPATSNQRDAQLLYYRGYSMG